jgi:tetratricopeptide (TPR) repeat protein
MTTRALCIRVSFHPFRNLLLCGAGLLCVLQVAYALPDEPQTQPSTGAETQTQPEPGIEVQTQPAGAGPQSRPSLHTLVEIYKIMDDSKLVYEIGSDENLAPPPVAEPAKGLSDQAWLVEHDGGYSLKSFTLSGPARAKLTEAEEAYKAKDYDRALEGYKEVQKLEPDYHHVLTLMGDVYYSKEGYETARTYYEEAIQKNFADYQAHWFLGDALWKLDRKKEAMEQITIAHLLNVSHASLRKVFLGYRNKIGRPWKDWQFTPRYALSQEGKKVKIQAAMEWLGYACVKAVWKYEPGYAERMAGPDYAKRVIIMEEEKEALVAYLSQEHPLPILSTILDEGYINEFIYYEMLAPKAPTAMVMFPRESFMRIVEYIDRYH